LFRTSWSQFSLGSALIWSNLHGQMPSASLWSNHTVPQFFIYLHLRIYCAQIVLYLNIYIKMVTQCLYRPRQALSIPRGWGSQISRQSKHEGGKVFSPKHRPPLPPRKYFWYSLLLEVESSPWAEGLSSGIESATFRLAVQCHNHMFHRGAFEYKGLEDCCGWERLRVKRHTTQTHTLTHTHTHTHNLSSITSIAWWVSALCEYFRNG
jgi:hypothetical protein